MVDDDDDGRTPDHGHPISSPCEPNGSGELIIEGYLMSEQSRLSDYIRQQLVSADDAKGVSYLARSTLVIRFSALQSLSLSSLMLHFNLMAF